MYLEEDASQIATEIEWDELYLEEDRSSRSYILRILKKIGTKGEIKYVNIFAQKAKKVDYYNSWSINEYSVICTQKKRSRDQEDAQRTIKILENRL